VAKAEQITVKAVLVYARTLRERASRARVADPYAEPYEISDAAARKVSQQLGPEGALTEIARRSKAHELRRSEAGARASHAAVEHRAHQLAVKGEREALAAARSLGQRLDAALHGLGLLSEAPTARLDGDRVSGSQASDRVFVGRRRLERDVLVADVEHLVRRAERLLESSRRRLVEEERAA
jgi:hypothetical protein